jgi:hypothetical protein
MRWPQFALALLLAAGSAVQAQATEELGSLLQDLGVAPAAQKQGRVQVIARIERNPMTKAAQLAIDLVPEGAARLVADPGITVMAVASEGVHWPGGTEARAVLPGVPYFDTPPRLRLPVEAAPGAPVEADVDYAWCLVGWQCLFGSERVRLTMPEAGTPAG